MKTAILTIAGSDSSGGAGLQGDLKTIAALGAYGASVVTAVTAQNTGGILMAEGVAPRLVQAQLEAAFQDLRVVGVKSGALFSGEIVTTVARALRTYRPKHYVCDPVMRSSSGFDLLPDSCLEVLRTELLPLATLVTPNAREAEALAGISVGSLEEAEEAGRRILSMGPSAVLVKGGHLKGDSATDVLVTREGIRNFAAPRLDAPHTHGTGCSYAAAVATHLGNGLPLPEAVARAKEFITEAIRGGVPVGRGTGPIDPFFFLPRRPREGRELRAAELHVITDETVQDRFTHPQLAKLAAEGGADAVQFREKRRGRTRHLVETARAMGRSLQDSATRLLVNDRVDVALASGAHGVHLGQGDMEPAIARRLLGPDAWIGATAHGLEEALRLSEEPVDYLGVGPVYGTGSKANALPPMGPSVLRRIVRSAGKPVIAIGNITPERVDEVMDAGVRGVAVIAAVVCQPDPLEATRRIREVMTRCMRVEG